MYKVSNPHANSSRIIISPHNHVFFRSASLLYRNPKVEEFYTKVQNYYPTKIAEIDFSDMRPPL